MASELAPSNNGIIKHQCNKPVTPPNDSLIIPQREPSNGTIVSLLAPNKGVKKPVHDWDAECQPPNGSSERFSKLPEPFCYANHLKYWTVDEDATKFWNKYGKKIAIKNLIISIGSLLLSFSVWMIWSVISVLLYNAWSDTCLNSDNDKCVYSFTTWYEDTDKCLDSDNDECLSDTYKSTLWLLPATAGLSGATLRLTNSFMIAPSGGRIVISQTAVISLLAMILLAAGLNNSNISMEYLIIVALITGCGGGAFASSMSNISFFFPNSKQGIALGLNAGIGNLGVSVMQILIAGITSYAAFGGANINNINGVYIANAAIIWIPFLIIFMIAAYFFLNSLPKHEAAGNTLLSFASFYWLEFLGYIGSSIAVIILIFVHEMMEPGYDILWGVLLWFICVSVTVLCMKFLICFKFLKGAHDNIKKTMAILRMPNTWIMTHLYIMTFGSFIGFSASFPMLIQELYPKKNPLFYAWLGPLVGSMSRPLGGWLSDRIGGATVTHFDVLVMITATIGVGITVVFGRENEELFPLFLTLFLLLFITTGIGNGSTFRMIPQIFTNKEHAGPVLGWTSAIAAYGAFIIPMIFKASIAVGGAEWAFFGFAFYYFTCLQVNWYFYYRRCWCRPCATRPRVYFA